LTLAVYCETNTQGTFFLLAMVLLSQCRKESGPVMIPDNNFLKALLALGIDTDGDGMIGPD
jgi:hypothetical protein